MKRTFNVKKDRNAKAVEFTLDMPETIDDTDLIVKRFGSVARMIDRANSQFTVDVARGVREALPDVAKAREYIENFCDDGKSAPRTTPRLTPEQVKKGNFDEDQIRMLRAAGMKI